MALSYMQSNTDGGTCTDGAFVSDTLCVVGGSAGSTPISITVGGSSFFDIIFILDGAGSTDKASGSWAVRLNVTTANMNLTASQAGAFTIGNAPTCNAFDQTIGTDDTDASLGSTGVKTWTFTGNAVTTSSPICVKINITNGAMSSQSFSFTPNQNIDSPFTAVTAPQPNVNDSVTITESVTARLNPMLFNVSDTATVTESVKMNMLLFPRPFDTVTVTEHVNMNLVNNIGVFDTVTVTEDARVHILVMPSVFDSVTVAESVTALLTSLNIAANDTVTLTESVTVTLVEAAAGLTVDVFDSVTVADDTVRVHILVMPAVNDAVTVTDAPQMNILVMPSVFDTVTTTESVTVSVVDVSAIQISAFDSVTVADDSTVLLPWLALFVTDSITVTEDITVTETGVEPPATAPQETPAGSAKRRRERFIARFRDQEYLFDSPDELEAFIESVRTPAQKRRGKKPAVRIIVPQEIERELSHLDLPSIKRQLERYQWQSAIETWKRYESIKGSFAESEGQIAMIFARQLEMEDEELLLL